MLINKKYVFSAIASYCILIGVGIVLLTFGTGCKKFLDYPPKDKVSQSKLFSNEGGYMDAMAGIYMGLNKPNGANKGLYTNELSMGFLSILSNNYDNASTVGLDNTFPNVAAKYSYTESVVKPRVAAIWNGMYFNISDANNLLTQIDDSKSIFTRDHFYRIKGEALGLRAMLHFDLLRMFAKPPLEGDGTTLNLNTKAIPYVKKFGIMPTPACTLGNALDSCIQDLKDAEELLAQTDTSRLVEGADIVYTSYTQNHLNYWAVKALLARVYLYKKDYTNAERYAKEVIGSGKFPLITKNVASATAGLTYRDRLFYQELVFAAYSFGVIDANELWFYKTSTTSTTENSQLTPNRGYLNYDSTATYVDWRISWMDKSPAGWKTVSKYFQDVNIPYTIKTSVPVIRISEMYYIVAECANRDKRTSEGAALLNLVRNARGLALIPIPLTISESDLDDEIMAEYKKEFLGEGQSYFYFKRLNKNLNVYAGVINPTSEDSYVFPIPDLEDEYNK